MAFPFPPPPDFYKLYKKKDDDDGSDAGLAPPPPGPPPPIKGEYTAFGAGHTTVQTQPPFDLTKLYRTEGGVGASCITAQG